LRLITNRWIGAAASNDARSERVGDAMSFQRFVIARRAARTGVAAAALCAMLFLWSGGQRPEMAHQSLQGLLLVVVFLIVMSLGVGVFLDWTWPMTTSRWHGAGLGFIAGIGVAIAMYLTLSPWHFGFRQILIFEAFGGFGFGAPYGAMWWKPPPAKDAAFRSESDISPGNGRG
jgi:hypothetical protein